MNELYVYLFLYHENGHRQVYLLINTQIFVALY